MPLAIAGAMCAPVARIALSVPQRIATCNALAQSTAIIAHFGRCWRGWDRRVFETRSRNRDDSETEPGIP